MSKAKSTRRSGVSIAFAGLLAVGCAVEAEERGGRAEALHPADLDGLVRSEASAHGVEPHPSLDRSLSARETEIVDRRAELGRFLFYDKALSGVEQTTCGTCHHAAFAYGDGRSVARGVFCTLADDGSQMFCDRAPSPGSAGNVVGPERSAPLNERNTPSVFNSALFPKQMLNGRFHFVDDRSTDVNELDPSLGFDVQPPEGVLFTRSLLGAQAFKPVPSPIEMQGDWPDVGEPFEDPVTEHAEVHAGLAARIDAIEAYHRLFEEAYGPDMQVFPEDPVITRSTPIEYGHIADALAHFQEVKLTFTDAPWDRFLAGDDHAISEDAKRGALLFFGEGRCAECHSGSLFSDFENHNIGVPQVGPGTGRSDPSDPRYLGLDTYDFGLEEITGERGDRFKFRTPPLRGVALTSPYMHNGCYATLEEALLHHARPRSSYAQYDIDQLEPDMRVHPKKPLQVVFDRQRNPVVVGAGASHDLELSEEDVDRLIAFLVSLTDPGMLEAANLAPAEVPSGLSVDVVGPARFPTYGSP